MNVSFNHLFQPFARIAAVCLLGMAFVLPVTAAAGTDPVSVLNSVANQLIEKLKVNKTNLHDNPQLVYTLAESVVVPHADISEMAKRVLPPATWKSATSPQRAQFEKEFATLLVHTYASALANYNDQSIHFFPVRGGANSSTTQVDSKIDRADGPPIAVSYRMVNRGGAWKMYDMTIEGISMLESFRAQFSDLLAQGNMNALLARLAAHNSGGK